MTVCHPQSPRRLVKLVCAGWLGLLAACGGSSNDPVATALSRPLAAPAAAQCHKGESDTATTVYVMVEGVCTRVSKLLPSAYLKPLAGASTLPDGMKRALAVHAPFTWASFLDWATRTYAPLFAGTPQDGVYLGYTYRYWPQTEYILAMDAGGRLFVQGPATDDELLAIGTLQELSCLVYPANCVTGGGTGTADVPGNTSSTVGLSVGVVRSSTIDTAADEDWYAVDLVAGTTYTVDLEGASTSKGTLEDPHLTLYSNAGVRLRAADDIAYPANLNARLQFTASDSGRYFIGAKGISSTGTYQLSMTAVSPGGGTGTPPPAGADIPNNTGTTARAVVGGAVNSTIDQLGDADWFAVDLTAGVTYTVDLEGQSTSRGTLQDPVLSFHDSSGQRLSSADDIDFPSNRNARLTVSPGSSGRYYLAASGYESVGTYRLSVAASSTPPGGDPVTPPAASDIPGNATTTVDLRVGSPRTSVIDPAGDVDWFVVNLTAGTAYVFDLEGVAAGAGTLNDPYLAVHSASGAQLATNDDLSSSNLDARLRFTPTASGTYYVSASGVSRSVGTYRLSMSTSTASTGVRLTTSTTGAGQGTVSPASGSFALGSRVTVTATPQFYSEFMGWTSNSSGCVGITLGCELQMDADKRMEARFAPVVFESAFDAMYTTTYAGRCQWNVSWSNTKLEVRYTLSGGRYVGSMRVVGRRQASVARVLGTTNQCQGSDTRIDQTFDLGPVDTPGEGVRARVLVFNGAGQEHLSLVTGGLPGPNIGGGSGAAGFIPVETILVYSGEGRSGSTTTLQTLMRLVR